MNYLAIDTSGKNLTVIVCKDGKTEYFFDPECGVNHSVSLMPQIESLCEKTGFDLEKADFFCAVVGAGSFTGIRIGVSTIKALCFAYQKPALSITSFDTIAYNATGGKVLAVIDAGHNGFYVCGYEDLKVVLPPCYLLKDQLLRIKDDYRVLSSNQIDGINCETVSVLDGLINAINQKLGETLEDLDALTPLYVRKSQAEEGRK
ncbi:MAG: tRNA (adenosine(37)-N6)-threonylcarbamoyltransferase complex dimerization subunit type 1 TsaB [Clostridia bacterium]|nr:tRNA (adenosine(37)-N6)-threonylcarbamoyltransferase complex dimerization subunit type 1 TsaB [Clostridia bacterium]